MAEFGEFTLPMPAAKAEKLESYVGKEVILGIRPSDFCEAVPNGVTLPTTVELAELMGAETNLYLECQGHKLIVCMPSYVRPDMNKEYHVGINMEKVHVFDKDTELAICH